MSLKDKAIALPGLPGKYVALEHAEAAEATAAKYSRPPIQEALEYLVERSDSFLQGRKDILEVAKEYISPNATVEDAGPPLTEREWRLVRFAIQCVLEDGNPRLYRRK